MSVLTNLLLLAICLSMLADGALHKNNDKNLRFWGKFRPRDLPPNPTQNNSYPCSTAPGSSGALLSSGSATGSGRFPLASGTANIGSSFGVVPYPTEGAPYQNSSSLYTTQANGEGENGQSGSGNQCPLQQTVTLPPQTITLPAQTVTVTPAPETITSTPQPQTETVTVTVTPQMQTTTVTVWMTVTANQAPSCPSPGNTASPQVAPVPAPNVQPSNTTIAPPFNNSAAPPVVPPIVSAPNLVVPLSTTVPIATATSPVIPNLGLTTTAEPAIIPVNNQTNPVTSSSLVLPIITSTPIKPLYPYRNTTNQTLPLGSGSYRGYRPTGSGFAKPTNRHLSSSFVSKFLTGIPISTIVFGNSSTRAYVPGNVSSLLLPPSQANVTTFQWTSGPTAPPSPTMEYFPDDGSTLLTPPAQANATTSPIMEYFPNDGSSLLKLPGQANATSVLPMGGATAPVITPAAVGSSQKLGMGVGSTTSPPPLIQLNTSSPISPVSTPIAPLAPPTLQPATSIPSTSQPVTNSTPPLCINGTTARNVTTNFSELPPIPTIPLIFQGLNYTTFTPSTITTPNTKSPLPPPAHLLAPAVSEPKQIAIAPASLSFSLASLTLSCGDTPAEVTTNCTLQMFGTGARATGSGAGTGITRYMVVGPGMQTVQMEQGWEGLSKVSITARVGDTQTGLMLAEVVYELVSAC